MSFLDKVFKFKKKPFAEKKASASVVSLEKTATPTVAKTETGIAHRVLMRALTTEKFAGRSGVYAFAVPREATKGQVREAVRSLYGVTPEKVNMVRVRGAEVRFGRTAGRQKDWKKAIVMLEAGKTIAIANREA